MIPEPIAVHRVATAALLRVLGGDRPIDRALAFFALVHAADPESYVPRERIADFVYGDRDDGGPEDVYGVLSVGFAALRRCGYVVLSRYGFGTRLVAIETDAIPPTWASPAAVRAARADLRRRLTAVERALALPTAAVAPAYLTEALSRGRSKEIAPST